MCLSFLARVAVVVVSQTETVKCAAADVDAILICMNSDLGAISLSLLSPGERLNAKTVLSD